MKCEFCDRDDAVKDACGHFACQEHTYFAREGNTLKPVCIACYEEAKASYLPKGTDEVKGEQDG